MAASAREYHTHQITYLVKQVTYEDSTAVTVGVLPAGALLLKPISGFVSTTDFNGTTPTMDMGTEANDDLYMTNGDIDTLGAFVPIDEAVSPLIASDTTVVAKFVGGGSNTTGVGYAIFAYVMPE